MRSKFASRLQKEENKFLVFNMSGSFVRANMLPCISQLQELQALPANPCHRATPESSASEADMAVE